MSDPKDDLDVQTFVMYHEEEEAVEAENQRLEQQKLDEEAAKSKKGKKGAKPASGGLFSKKPTPAAKPAPIKKAQPAAQSSGGGIPDSVKGLLIGLAIVIIVIAVDQLVLK